MARKKATTKKAKGAKTTRFTKIAAPKKQQSTVGNFLEYLRLGESYASLVLGIIVVIIATVLLLSVVHNRQEGKNTPEATPTLAASDSFAISTTVAVKQKIMGVGAMKQDEKKISAKTYTVVAGDNLWKIAEKVYKSGYNWVDIAKANKLLDPSDIHVGNKLVIPQVTPTMVATVHTADDDMATAVAPSKKIVGNTYVIVQGDDLWDIAVRAYGDGYQWVKIAKSNNLTDPNLIHVGNRLKIPRN